jgi:hypothetical protein
LSGRLAADAEAGSFAVDADGMPRSRLTAAGLANALAGDQEIVNNSIKSG